MDAIYTPVFLAIQNRIFEQTDIKHVNMDTGQLLDEQPAINYPAALIGFTSAAHTSIGSNAQLGVITISIKVVFDQNSHTSQQQPEAVRIKGLHYYELEQQLHRCLQGWAPAYLITNEDESTTDILADVTGYLERTTASVDNTRADLRIRTLTYTLSVDDYGTMPPQLYAPISDMGFGCELIVGDLEDL